MTITHALRWALLGGCGAQPEHENGCTADAMSGMQVCQRCQQSRSMIRRAGEVRFCSALALRAGCTSGTAAWFLPASRASGAFGQATSIAHRLGCCTGRLLVRPWESCLCRHICQGATAALAQALDA